MKILYGIQGTGHGHISRAREIIPILSEQADLDILISGTNCKMTLDGKEATRKQGISLAYDSKGGVSFLKTALGIQPVRLLRDIRSVSPSNYDLVISDYEPISAWASRTSGVASVALSHQASFLSEKSPRPGKISLFAEQILKNFAPCDTPIGFHFRRYDSFILPPVIRQDVLNLQPQDGDHVIVYLPAFEPKELIKVLKKFDSTEWHLFSPFCDFAYRHGNVRVFPVGNKPFLESMKNSRGVLTSAGFETCAETMYLNKKLFVIPIQNQYEQLCNAAALQELGVTVAQITEKDFLSKLQNWLKSEQIVSLPEIADIPALRNTLFDLAGIHHPDEAESKTQIYSEPVTY
ncbi:MAG: glycosyltransferase family protein [Balneolaceae bacterium]|nr:glycosyltransferase family protein [Balneolaceae bacterium]